MNLLGTVGAMSNRAAVFTNANGAGKLDLKESKPKS